jgi:hypothetical protein
MYPLNFANIADLNMINRVSAWMKASGFVATFVPTPVAAKQETRLLRQIAGDASFWDAWPFVFPPLRLLAHLDAAVWKLGFDS